MRGDIDLREIDLKKLRFSRRTLSILVIVLVVVTGGYFAWRSVTNPPRPWLVRWKLDCYLAKQAHTSDFKVSFPFPSKAEMAKSPKSNEDDKGPMRGSRTGKDFETLREEYLAQKTAALALQREVVRSEANLKDAKSKLEVLTKEGTESQTTNDAAAASNVQSNIAASREQIALLEKSAARRSELQAKEEVLTPIVDDLWEFQRTWIADAAGSDAAGAESLAKARRQLLNDTQERLNNASSYEAMYQAIGQELFVAKHLLESGNREHRREGMSIALTAARHAIGYAMNGSVAARICEGYVLPNLDLATDRNTRSTFNEENLLGQCADIFRRNEEPNNVVRVYELYLDNIKNPARADWARSQIAMAYRQAGDAKGELTALRQIKDTNSFRFQMRRMAQLEQEAKSQR
jgi:hypothetical protein